MTAATPAGAASAGGVQSGSVTVKRAPLDYRMVLSYTLETRLDDGYVITDEYRADGRTVITKKGNVVIKTEEYQNLIGRIPVVHIAHGRSGNETYGHSGHEDYPAPRPTHRGR